jgi:hypothetical protein
LLATDACLHHQWHRWCNSGANYDAGSEDNTSTVAPGYAHTYTVRAVAVSDSDADAHAIDCTETVHDVATICDADPLDVVRRPG